MVSLYFAPRAENCYHESETLWLDVLSFRILILVILICIFVSLYKNTYKKLAKKFTEFVIFSLQLINVFLSIQGVKAN